MDPRRARGTLRRAAADPELLGDLRRSKPALYFACLVWPIFGLIDLAHVRAGGEGDLVALLAVRAIPMPWFLVAAWRVRRRPPISARELTVLIYGAIYVLFAVLALECLPDRRPAQHVRGGEPGGAGGEHGGPEAVQEPRASHDRRRLDLPGHHDRGELPVAADAGAALRPRIALLPRRARGDALDHHRDRAARLASPLVAAPRGVREPQHRPLRAAAPHRQGRHGRGVGRVAPRPRARGGAEDPAPLRGERRERRGALRARGAPLVGPLAPAHRAGVRLRDDRGRAPLLRDGAARGHEPRRAGRRRRGRSRPSGRCTW
ncbi:MAG: hypothetical protein M5U28_02255 [Sandaracinaceae bacterium]|nr:hypothetical protein [Sandaracinaceae bacterium]